jgi:hypothetical protein
MVHYLENAYEKRRIGYKFSFAVAQETRSPSLAIRRARLITLQPSNPNASDTGHLLSLRKIKNLRREA